MSHLWRKAAVTALAAGTCAGMLATTAGPSSAASQSSATKTNYVLNAVGSDTIYCVDNSFSTHSTAYGIFKKYTLKQAGSTGNGNSVIDTAPGGGLSLGCDTPATTATVPGDSVHGQLSYADPPAPTPSPSEPPGNGNACNAPLSGVGMPWAFPFGSSAGIACFVDDQGAGNVAFARSSRGRKSSDPSNLEFWAFGLDAVTWAAFPGSPAPTNMTPSSLQNIYNCTWTDWSQVPGHKGSGAIHLYYPQVGSGTGDFFGSIMLGFRPAPASTGCNSTIHFVAENDGTQAGGAGTPDPLAIMPYSYAVWTAQSHSSTDFETDLRNGATLHAVNGTKPTATTVSESAANFNTVSGQDACTAAPVAGQYCGSRYVYHVTWDGAVAPAGGFGLSSSYYAAVIDLIGVPNNSTGTAGANSICANKYSSTLKLYGFKPLAFDTTTQQGSYTGAGVPGKSYCRLF